MIRLDRMIQGIPTFDMRVGNSIENAIMYYLTDPFYVPLQLLNAFIIPFTISVRNLAETP